MYRLTPEDIARVTGGKYFGDEAFFRAPISRVIRDNREAVSGALFVCIPGARVDGHDFAARAHEAGCICSLASRPLPDGAGPYVLVDDTLKALRSVAAYYRSLIKTPVVSVIGSVGKTSAKEMTAAVLGQKYRVHKTPENLNNDIGVPLSLLGIGEEHEAAVIEMGISDFGEMSVLAEMVRPDVCIFTNVGYCHLERLGDLDGVLRAKSEVFKFMRPDALAAVNGDDERLRALDTGTRKKTFGYSGCDYTAENIETDGFERVSCDICALNSRFHVEIPAFGSHFVLAALAAAAVGSELGLTNDEIARGIAAFKSTGARADVIKTGHINIINDCYNANPNSVSAALRSLSSVSGRRVAILGDMLELGEGSARLHRYVGELAKKYGIDTLLCCGPESRETCAGFGAGGVHFEEKSALLAALPKLVKSGDTALVKASHGMHFEDVTEALKAL